VQIVKKMQKKLFHVLHTSSQLRPQNKLKDLQKSLGCRRACSSLSCVEWICFAFVFQVIRIDSLHISILLSATKDGKVLQLFARNAAS